MTDEPVPDAAPPPAGHFECPVCGLWPVWTFETPLGTMTYLHEVKGGGAPCAGIYQYARWVPDPTVATGPAEPTQAEIRAAILGPDAGDRPRFWWSPTKALIRGGRPGTVPADAVELVPRTAIEQTQPDDEALDNAARAARDQWWRLSYSEKDQEEPDGYWEEHESVRKFWADVVRAALAALREQQHG